MRIAILIVAYRGSRYLAECLEAIERSNLEDNEVEIFLVENGCPESCCQSIATQFPTLHIVSSESNRGFAGGNNLGWQTIRQQSRRFDFLMLLNQDTRVEPAAIAKAATYLCQNQHVGAVQSLLLLWPETELINTAGNQSHFLGFGFTTHDRESIDAAKLVNGEIGYASGAAVMLRCELIERTGLFEERMFMYLEDADLSWKMRLIGFPPHLCCDSVVFHEYRFHSRFEYLRYLEQNRWWLLLAYYKWQTLLLFFPAAFVMELGQLFFATIQGRLIDKLRGIGFLLSPTGITAVSSHRLRVQSSRQVSDAEMLRLAVGAIRSPHLSGFLVRRIASPFFTAYWFVVKRLLFW